MNALQDTGLWRTQAYVNGEWIDADNGSTNKVTNPANGEVIVDGSYPIDSSVPDPTLEIALRPLAAPIH